MHRCIDSGTQLEVDLRHIASSKPDTAAAFGQPSDDSSSESSSGSDSDSSLSSESDEVEEHVSRRTSKRSHQRHVTENSRKRSRMDHCGVSRVHSKKERNADPKDFFIK